MRMFTEDQVREAIEYGRASEAAGYSTDPDEWMLAHGEAQAFTLTASSVLVLPITTPLEVLVAIHDRFVDVARRAGFEPGRLTEHVPLIIALEDPQAVATLPAEMMNAHGWVRA